MDVAYGVPSLRRRNNSCYSGGIQEEKSRSAVVSLFGACRLVGLPCGEISRYNRKQNSIPSSSRDRCTGGKPY